MPDQNTNYEPKRDKFLAYDDQGRPMQSYDDFAVPHVLTFSSIVSGASKTYYHDRWDEAMKHSRESALIMRRDAFLMGLLRERIEGTASLKWSIAPDNPQDQCQIEVAAEVQAIIQNIPRLSRMIRKLLDAIWFGRYGLQVKWGFTQFRGRRVFTVKKYLPVNGDKIGYGFDGVPYVLVHASEAQAQLPESASTMQTTIARAVRLDGALRNNFIIHTFDPDDSDFFEGEMAGSIGGVGIRSRLFWLDWLRREYCSWVVDMMERTGLGLVVIYYDRGNAAARAEAEAVAHDYSRRAVIVMPKSPLGDKRDAGIDVVETPTAGAQILLDMQKHIEDIEERYTVGQSLSSSTEGSGLGGTGVAGFQAQTKAKIIAYDASELQETLTGSDEEPGLVNTIKKWTFPWADFPLFWKFHLEDPQPEKTIQAAHLIWQMGGEIVEDELLSKAGLRKSMDGDTVLKQQDPMEMGMGGEDDQGMEEGDGESENAGFEDETGDE